VPVKWARRQSGRRPGSERQIPADKGQLDVAVNDAGMLMTGVTEAFSVEQVARNERGWERSCEQGGWCTPLMGD